MVPSLRRLPSTLVSWTCTVPKVAGKGDDLVAQTGSLVLRHSFFQKMHYWCIRRTFDQTVFSETREHKDSERNIVAWTDYSERVLTSGASLR